MVCQLNCVDIQVWHMRESGLDTKLFLQLHVDCAISILSLPKLNNMGKVTTRG